MASNSDMMNELRSLQAQVMHFKDLHCQKKAKRSPARRAATPGQRC